MRILKYTICIYFIWSILCSTLYIFYNDIIIINIHVIFKMIYSFMIFDLTNETKFAINSLFILVISIIFSMFDLFLNKKYTFILFNILIGILSVIDILIIFNYITKEKQKEIIEDLPMYSLIDPLINPIVIV